MCTSHSHAPSLIQESPSTEEWGSINKMGPSEVEGAGRRRREKDFRFGPEGTLGVRAEKLFLGWGFFWRKECPLFLKNFPRV